MSTATEFLDGTPTAVVVLDRPRTIAFTLGTLRRVKEKLGTLALNLEDAPDTGALAVYLWACLSATGRAELSVEQIEDMVHPLNIGAINDAIAALFAKSRPDPVAANPTPAAPIAAT